MKNSFSIAGSTSIGRVAIGHQLDSKTRSEAKNVDPSLSLYNRKFVDRLQGQTLEQYTNQRMQQVIDAYNEKQKRPDRQMKTDYCTYHKGNGNLSKVGKMSGQLAYETVIQLGSHEDIGGAFYRESGERQAKIANRFNEIFNTIVGEWQRRYPNLEILVAQSNLDEPNGTPHVHITWQPVGHYQKGLSEQIAIGRALEECGIERLKTRAEAEVEGGFQIARAHNLFTEQVLNPIIKQLGYGIKEVQHGRKHIDSNGFADLLQKAEKERAEVMEQTKQMKQELNQARSELSTLETQRKYEAEVEKGYDAWAHAEWDQVKHIPEKKQFGKVVQEAAVLMPEEEYRRLRQIMVADGALNEARQLSQRAERQHQEAMKPINERVEEATADLKAELEQVHYQMEQQQQEISRLQKLTQNLRRKIDYVRTFFQDWNLTQTFNEWLYHEKEREQQQEQEQEIE